jgi:hypothetical protein
MVTLHREPSEQGKVEKAFRRSAAILAIAVGAATLSACGPATEPGPSPTVSAASPEATATPTPEAISASLEALYAESPDVFVARPMEERKELCAAEMIKLPLDRVGEAYASKTGNEYDKMQGPISIDNDPQAILSSVVNLNRLAAIQKTPDIAVKIYSCLYVDPLNSDNFIEGKRSIEEDGAFGYPIEAIANDGKIQGEVPTSIADSIDGVDASGEPTRTQMLGSRGTDGTEYVGTYVFIGGDQPFWSTEE